MSPAIHAPVAECPSRCQETNYETVSAICSGPMSNHWFSLIAHFYLQCVNCYSRYSFSFSFWHRRSTRRGTSFHRWVIRAVKMLPTEIRTTVMNMFCKKSSGRIPVLYILFISLVIVCIPFSPSDWRNSAGMLSAPVALFLVNFVMIVLISISDIVHDSVVFMSLLSELLLSLYNSSTYRAHLSRITCGSYRTGAAIFILYCL